MNRLIILAISAVSLAGCIVPTRRGPVMVAPLPPAPVIVAHVHGPGCGHHWGYYSGYPVYYQDNVYSYYDGGTWIRMDAPPEVYYRHHQAAPVYAAPPPVHAASPVYAAPPPPAHSAAPVYSAPPPPAHSATPVYNAPPPPAHGATPVYNAPPPPAHQATPAPPPHRHERKHDRDRDD